LDKVFTTDNVESGAERNDISPVFS